jgi:hypothetical protein
MNPEITIFLSQGFTLLFYILMLCFSLFSIATFYHWFTFGNSKSISMISLVTYLVVSAPLFAVMLVSLSYI